MKEYKEVISQTRHNLSPAISGIEDIAMSLERDVRSSKELLIAWANRLREIRNTLDRAGKQEATEEVS